MEKNFVPTDQKMIESFISEYKRSHIIIETTVRATLKRALQYEKIFQKSFTEFIQSEILIMLKEIEAISATSLQNQILILRNATNWINFVKGIKQPNIYDTITKSDIKECVIQRNFITQEQLHEIQGQLLNVTDRTILFLLFEGVGGRWCSELTYLEPQQVSQTDKMIYFRNGKIISMSSEECDMLYAAFAETELISYNQMKVAKVMGNSIYKYRANTIHENADKNSENDLERRFRWCQRRLKIIGDYVDVKLTVTTLQNAGLFHYIQKGMNNMNLTFREFIHTNEAKQLARRYDIFNPLYIQTLADKFSEYLD